ncbi:MAG: VanZ family protein [Gemmatimonadales bacterium]
MTTRRFGLVLSVALILGATLHSSGGASPSGWSLTFASSDTAAAEIAQNLLLFVPLGVALALAGMRPRRAIVLGGALSVTVEFLQQWIPGRDPSFGDIVCNTLGTALGVTLVRMTPRWLSVGPRRAARRAFATALLAAAAWLAAGWLSLHPAHARTLTFARVWEPRAERTIGDGWKVMVFPEMFPDWVLAVGNALWLGGWTGLLGYWVGRAAGGGRTAALGVAAAILTAGALFVIPWVVGLRTTPLWEVAVAVGGLAVGYAIARKTALAAGGVNFPPRSGAGSPAES